MTHQLSIEEKLRKEWRDPENQAYQVLCSNGLNGRTEDFWLSKMAEERERLVGRIEQLRGTGGSSKLWNSGYDDALDTVLQLIRGDKE